MSHKNQLNAFRKIFNVAKNNFSLQPKGKKNTKKEQTEQKEIIRRLRIQNKKLQEQLTNLRKKVKQNNTEKAKLIDKMEGTKRLNYLLAEALGSCPECWGQDQECANCLGNGISGWHKINKRLFNVYVLPALEKLYGLSRKIK